MKAQASKDEFNLSTTKRMKDKRERETSQDRVSADRRTHEAKKHKTHKKSPKKRSSISGEGMVYQDTQEMDNNHE